MSYVLSVGAMNSLSICLNNSMRKAGVYIELPRCSAPAWSSRHSLQAKPTRYPLRENGFNVQSMSGLRLAIG